MNKDLILVDPHQDIDLLASSQQAVSALQFAKSRIIKTVEDMKLASDDLNLIRKLKRLMETKRKDYLFPFQDHIKEVNEAYKQLMEPVEEADKLTSGKMLAFTAEQDRIRREQERINAERMKLAQDEMKLTGELTESVNLVEVLPPIATTTKTEFGASSLVKKWEFEVVDFSLLPDQYKLPDMVKIRKVITAGVTIPGVKSWQGTNLRTKPA